MEWNAVLILTYILNIIIIIITVYLIILYIKSNSFKIYPCYNILILSFVMLFDNILRIIFVGDIDALKYIQAITLTSLDKFLLTTLTAQIFIIYMGVCNTKLYFSREKCIFFSTLLVGLFISIVLGVVYVNIEGLIMYGIYNYTHDSIPKRISDTIFNAVFLLINTICCVLLLIYISNKRKEASLGIIEDLDYGHHHTKVICMFIFNSLLFIESYLIIYDKFPTDEVDLIYLITCIVILLYYTLNKIIMKETCRIFCKSYYDKNYPTVKKNDSIIGEECENDDEDGKISED